MARRLLTRISMALMLTGAVIGQNSTSSGQTTGDEIASKSIAYANRATSGIREMMHDPTSFTVLEVISITKQEKDGSTSFSGCVHYIGSNLYGGRMQQHGSYSVNKKGQLTVWTGTETSYCETHKNEVHVVVTDEVQRSLSGNIVCGCKVISPMR